MSLQELQAKLDNKGLTLNQHRWHYDPQSFVFSYKVGAGNWESIRHITLEAFMQSNLTVAGLAMMYEDSAYKALIDNVNGDTISV